MLSERIKWVHSEREKREMKSNTKRVEMIKHVALIYYSSSNQLRVRYGCNHLLLARKLSLCHEREGEKTPEHACSFRWKRAKSNLLSWSSIEIFNFRPGESFFLYKLTKDAAAAATWFTFYYFKCMKIQVNFIIISRGLFSLETHCKCIYIRIHIYKYTGDARSEVECSFKCPRCGREGERASERIRKKWKGWVQYCNTLTGVVYIHSFTRQWCSLSLISLFFSLFLPEKEVSHVTPL